jgi:hypothetical protein
MVQHLKFFFHSLFEKYITNKNLDTIIAICTNWANVNFDVTNASNNLWRMLVTLIKYWWSINVILSFSYFHYYICIFCAWSCTCNVIGNMFVLCFEMFVYIHLSMYYVCMYIFKLNIKKKHMMPTKCNTPSWYIDFKSTNYVIVCLISFKHMQWK